MMILLKLDRFFLTFPKDSPLAVWVEEYLGDIFGNPLNPDADWASSYDYGTLFIQSASVKYTISKVYAPGDIYEMLCSALLHQQHNDNISFETTPDGCDYFGHSHLTIERA